MLVQQKKDNPALRGDRIKSARMLAGYTRKAFSDLYSIPVATVRAWEEPPINRGGVTLSGAKRLIKVFQESGIYCTEDWILHGKGPGPTLIDSYRDESEQAEISWGEEESILRDIESFKQNNRDSMVAAVSDAAMLPLYGYGDYVGGRKREGSDIAALVGLNCIVEFENKIMVRKIVMANAHGRYTLAALNMEQTGPVPVLHDVELVAAAQVVWHRGRSRDTLNTNF